MRSVSQTAQTRFEKVKLEQALSGTSAIALSWHGVLFDRHRHEIHAAIRSTFAHWGVDLLEAELITSRGPTGRAQIARLLSTARIAERFRSVHHHWATETEIELMERDLEPRLLAAAEAARTPNADACDAIRRLHARGIRTAVIACIPRRLIQPQLDALAAAGVPLDAVVTADEACDPAPAPWGIFEVVRQLGLTDASTLALIDDCPDGATAARNAGARSIGLQSEGAAPLVADATIRELSEVASGENGSKA